jgi:hypothetical protein
MLRNAADQTPLEGHLLSTLAHCRAVCEAFDTVCRKNVRFSEEVLAGSRLSSAVDELRDIERSAREFVQHRQDLKSERVRELVAGKSMPLFGEEDQADADGGRDHV